MSHVYYRIFFFFFFQAEDGIRDYKVTGVQTCALPIYALLARSRRRRRTAEHERVWLNLAGWCLRPGVGAELDGWRMQQVWQLHGQGLGHGGEAANRTEWWVFWRRVAAGLDEARQMELLEEVAGHMQKAVQQSTQRRDRKSTR